MNIFYDLQFGRFADLWDRTPGIGAGTGVVPRVAPPRTCPPATRRTAPTGGDRIYHIAGGIRRATHHQAPEIQTKSNHEVIKKKEEEEEEEEEDYE